MHLGLATRDQNIPIFLQQDETVNSTLLASVNLILGSITQTPRSQLVHSIIRLACYYTLFTIASKCFHVNVSRPQQKHNFLDKGSFASIPVPVLSTWLSVLNTFINGYYEVDAQC